MSDKKKDDVKKKPTVSASGTLPMKADNVVLEEIKAGRASGAILPSKQVLEQFKNNVFNQAELDYLIKNGERNRKYDYAANGRVVYGVSVVDKDKKAYYAQFDIVSGKLIKMEKIEAT